ncbi:MULTISPECIES: DUF1801 domain-containing protein [unclassified Arthrobacter]|uniref:DUF1801 domain-containing protein n=1 Tax=unclassified Arthrobacter TaxID=235627 RepID=UPI002E0E0EBF|nr:MULTISPECIES: DUF1801 domain-containing protein [unclassified Arthrobacter]
MPVNTSRNKTENKTTATGASVQEFLAAVGFSPRKAGLSLYGLSYGPQTAELLARLGKHKTGAGCLHVNKLDDVDQTVLTELIRHGYRHATSILNHPRPVD